MGLTALVLVGQVLRAADHDRDFSCHEPPESKREKSCPC